MVDFRNWLQRNEEKTTIQQKRAKPSNFNILSVKRHTNPVAQIMGDA